MSIDKILIKINLSFIIMNKQQQIQQQDLNHHQISNSFYQVQSQQNQQIEFNGIQLSNSYSTSSPAKSSSIDSNHYITLVNNSNINNPHILIQNQPQNINIPQNESINNNNNNISSLTSLLQNFSNNSNINVPTSSSLASSSSPASSLNNTNNNMINNLTSNDFDFLSECANSINIDKKLVLD